MDATVDINGLVLLCTESPFDATAHITGLVDNPKLKDESRVCACPLRDFLFFVENLNDRKCNFIAFRGDIERAVLVGPWP
jgi:hypothetical protein